MKTYVFEEGYEIKPHTSRFNSLEYTISAEGCWEVVGRENSKKGGYTRITRNGKLHRTHKYVYEIVNGEVPSGMVVRHNCHNKRCINPEHLSIGTQKENIADNYEVGSILTGLKHGLTSLTKEQYHEITHLLDEGYNYTEIKRKTGVCRHIAKKIAERTHWSCEEYGNETQRIDLRN